MGSKVSFRFMCEGEQPLTGRYVILDYTQTYGLDVAEIELYLNGELKRPWVDS